MSGAFIIPLLALLFPIVLLLIALLFDAAFVSWAAYRLWHDRPQHWIRRLLHH